MILTTYEVVVLIYFQTGKYTQKIASPNAQVMQCSYVKFLVGGIFLQKAR